MGLLDLGNVTRVLIRLLEEAIALSPAWDGTHPAVSPLPPDKLGEAGDVLGLYLYHVGEDPHFRNAPPEGSGPHPVALAPMGLLLHYQLTAHTTASTEAPEGAYKAQLLFGLALKTLHDHASIVDGKEINGVPLLATYGLEDRQNRFRIGLRQVPVEDAVTYWTAGQGPLRLAAYYQVSVAMLEPDAPPSRSAKVLERGVHVFVSGPPHLSGSRNEITFTLPGATTPRTIVSSPAQVPLGERFSLFGTDLVGDGTDLLLEAKGSERIVADPLAWGVVVRGTELSATVPAPGSLQAVIPGVYAATVEVRRTLESAGGTREIVHASNRTAIVIAPIVADPGAHAAGATLSLNGGIFAHPDIPTDPEHEDAVEVIVGATKLTLDDDASLAPGEFEIVDATQITLRLPPDLPPGFQPVRVRVRGAESPPRWIEVTS